MGKTIEIKGKYIDSDNIASWKPFEMDGFCYEPKKTLATNVLDHPTIQFENPGIDLEYMTGGSERFLFNDYVGGEKGKEEAEKKATKERDAVVSSIESAKKEASSKK